MSNRILVTYATCTGSTTGVAEAIAKTLTERGAQVDLRLMTEVTNVTPYDAVVAGSAIHAGKWLPEALEFVQTHRAQLAQKPFAAFLVCITLAMKNPKFVEKAQTEQMVKWLDPIRALVPVISEGQFAGALDISKIPTRRDRFLFRISVMMGTFPEGDHRDWNAIRAWANELPLKLFQQQTRQLA